jgi:hypothetical protein
MNERIDDTDIPDVTEWLESDDDEEEGDCPLFV